MSISGSLEDVAVGDVLQFILLGKRTGTLELERDGEQARFGFHDGALVAARAPGAPRLGQLLVERGYLDATALGAVMARQAEGTPRRSLGRMLVEEGQLSREVLESVVRLQLELAVEQVFRWDRGSFDFALDEIRPIDEIGTEAFDLEPSSGLGSNVVLLEAARIFDERDRLGATKTVGEASDDAFDGLIDEEVGTFAGPVVRVLSPDREFIRQLRLSVGGQATLRRVTLARASDAADEGDTDILLIDARADALDAELLAALRESRPEARLVVLVDSNNAMQVAYRHGAVAAVPAELETVRACLANLLETAPPLRGAEGPGRGEPGLRRLQRVFGDLKSGLASATVALNLMQLVSESYERAVIFLVKRDRLAPLGAFGFARNGSPLASAVRRLEIVPEGLLQEALATSQVRTANFQRAALPAGLASILGPPTNDQVVVFPVAGSERVIAVVYADNGTSSRALRDVELLEVAAEQVGIAFENELLRRQLGR
ncbi:MAG: DUF4388 domain-containing protein [Thermoanaerobaculia bacterium]